jgi:hypothetical protein
MDQNEIPHDPSHLVVTSGASKMIFEQMVHATQSVHLSCVKISAISKRMEFELPLEPRYLGVPSGASKMISKHMVRLAQPMHLCCVKISNIPKQNETSIHLSLIIQAYIQCKMCTYLLPRLTLSPNRPKQIPHDPSRLGVTSSASKMISEPMVRSTRIVHLLSVKISTISKRNEMSIHMSPIT